MNTTQPSTGRVAGKVCIVTGAATGIGKADAELLIQEGAYVVVSDVDETQGKATASALGPRAVFMKHDVRSEDDWRRVIATTVERFGRLNVLVNNAGVIAMGDIESATLESWRFVNSVNVEGTFLGCKHALPAIRASGGGCIVNVSSSTAIQGYPASAAYTASKGAITALTRMIAVHCIERGDNIRCNAVCPHMVESQMSREGIDKYLSTLPPDQRPEIQLASPVGVAKAVLFLASDDSSELNGAALNLDRGTSCVSAR